MADQRDQHQSQSESPPHSTSRSTTALVSPPSTRRRSPSDSTVATSTVTTTHSSPQQQQRQQLQQQPVVASIQPEMAGPAASLLDAFRKRSKSDSKSKRPSFISAIRNSHLNPFGDHHRNRSAAANTASGGSHDSAGNRGGLLNAPPHVMNPNHPLASSPAASNDPYYTYSYQGEYKSRSRSGSGSSAPSGIPRVFDIFNRSRSQSIAASTELNKQKSSSQRELFLDKLDLSDIMNAAEGMVFVKFFQYYQCYDLIPISAKLIVFDTQLLVKKAFHALISNGVRAVPLWESASQSFVGMVTITDFINILRTYYRSPTTYKFEELEEQKLEMWRTVMAVEKRPLVSITPQTRLFETIKTLIHNKVHRLPVIDPDTGNVLYIMTHKRILKFLFLYYKDLPLPSYVDTPIGDLQIGTYENIATASMSTPLIEVLDTFIERRVSALPVVDAKGKVIDIYAKFDVINLATEKTYNNLDMTVRKALEFRSQYFEGVVKCTRQDSFRLLFEKIVRAEVHRIVVVDENDHVIGMISLSDILSFLTLKPVLLERADLAAVAATIAAAVKAKETHTLVEESEDEEEEEEESDAESESDHGGDGAPAVLESPVKSERLTTTIEKLASTKLTSNTRNEDDDKEDDVFSLDDGGGGGHTMVETPQELTTGAN